MNDWIATDLDGTLFSRAWSSDGAVAATWSVDLETGERLASSWMPASTHRVLSFLQKTAALVPVTARDTESFARVDIPGLTLDGPAIIANGGIILDRDGKIDQAWEAEMADRLHPWTNWMEVTLSNLVKQSAGHARPRLVFGPSGLPIYLVAKAPDSWWETPRGREVRESYEWAGCRLSLQGDELQVLPSGLSKANALTEVMGRYFDGIKPLLCFGDMPADLEFMRMSSILATPMNSALDRAWPDQ